jgi:hypothetical protein
MNCEWCGELTDVKKLRATIFHLQLRIEELEKQSFESVELLMKGEALRSKMMLDSIMNGAFNHIVEGKKNASINQLD